MSGNLRLNGTTSGYSELTAPAVAGDQTFTFPAAGGVLATTPNGGPPAAYQQGMWMPTIAASGKNDPLANNSGVWMFEGVSNAPGGPGSGNDPYVAPALSTFDWWRIGNAVTLRAYCQFLATDPNNNATLQFRRLPYPIAPPYAGQTYNPFTGTCYNSGNFSPSEASGARCSVVPYFWTGSTGDPDWVFFRYVNGTVSLTADKALSSADVNRNANPPSVPAAGYMQWQATYLTNDTDWIPNNGATLT